MSLVKMGRPSETVRFMDEVDINFTMDSRITEKGRQMLIEISTNPVVFRASYRDITVINSIATKALQFSDSPPRFNDKADGSSSNSQLSYKNRSGDDKAARKNVTEHPIALMSREKVGVLLRFSLFKIFIENYSLMSMSMVSNLF